MFKKYIVILVVLLFILISYEYYIRIIESNAETFALNKEMNASIDDMNSLKTIGKSEENMKFKVFVINLKKDKERYNKFLSIYNNSDMNKFPVTRYEAVEGDKQDVKSLLTPKALDELNMISIYGFRTAHYQISKGGVGCFLSHLNLAKQLLTETTVDNYLIFEDDTNIFSKPYEHISHYMQNVPDDWDYIMFYVIRLEGNKVNNDFAKPNAFWGMNCYFINKKGAKKFVDEVERTKIDGQIDSYMARMSQKNKLNIYVCIHQFIEANSIYSNIQSHLVTFPHIDPYVFDGFHV
jgi:GR25 family glycosyltransferase involved in LPS biosynthesis